MIAHVEIDADAARGAGDLEHPRRSGKRAGYQHTNEDQTARIDASKTGCTRALAGKAHVKTETVTGEDEIGEDHRRNCRHDSPVDSRIGDQFEVGRGGILRQVAASGEAVAVGVAQEIERHRRLNGLGHIDEHERDEDLVRLEADAQEGGDRRPEHPARKTGDDHQGKNQPAGFHWIEGEAGSGGSQCADDILALGADVPNARTEAEGQANRDKDQRACFDEKLGPRIRSEIAEDRIVKDRPDRLERRLAEKGEDTTANDHGDHDGENRRGIDPSLAGHSPFLKHQHGRPPYHGRHQA